MFGQFFSGRIFFVRCHAGRQLNPPVLADLVDGNLRRREARIRKRAYGYANGVVVPVFTVEDGRAANRAKPEREPGSLIADAYVFGGSADNLEGSRKACEYRERAAGPLLAGEAVANAHSSRFAFDFNAQLSAGARGCSGNHRCLDSSERSAAGGA